MGGEEVGGDGGETYTEENFRTRIMESLPEESFTLLQHTLQFSTFLSSNLSAETKDRCNLEIVCARSWAPSDSSESEEEEVESVSEKSSSECSCSSYPPPEVLKLPLNKSPVPPGGRPSAP